MTMSCSTSCCYAGAFHSELQKQVASEDRRARLRRQLSSKIFVQSGITPCSTKKANPPHFALDRSCYKKRPFVSFGRNGKQMLMRAGVSPCHEERGVVNIKLTKDI
jgi:hypothetical protein